MRRLPPLNALRVFEVAARTGSYAAAAAELGLTHGAVSRHVATLEAWLGQTLFRRDGRRMVATPIAAMFADEVGHAFDRVGRAADACGRPATRRILRVSAPTSFAMRWLIPRLNRFHADHPHVEVVVSTVSTLLEDLRGGFDIAIRRGVTSGVAWPGHRVVPVLEDIDMLIASPALLKQRPIRTAADIEGHVLLASETRATGPTGSTPPACRIWRACPARYSIISSSPGRLSRTGWASASARCRCLQSTSQPASSQPRSPRSRCDGRVMWRSFRIMRAGYRSLAPSWTGSPTKVSAQARLTSVRQLILVPDREP